MSITPDQLTTLSNVKALLGIGLTDTTQDAALNFLIISASAAITENCNRPFFLSGNAANPITEYYSGSGDQWLVLRQWPVQSIASIYLDDGAYWGQNSGAFGSQTLLVEGQDYALAIDSVNGTTSRSAMVFRINNVWDCQWNRDGWMLASYPTTGRGNIKITYTCGFLNLPPDLTYAATMIVARMYNSGKYGAAIKSEGYENYNYSLEGNPDPKWGIFGGEVGPILAKYRITPVGVAV